MARTFVLLTLVAGVLMLILGGGLFFGTWKSLAGFTSAVAADPAGFVSSETACVDATMAQYGTAVFRVMPLMIAVAALLVVFLPGPGWRAAAITAIIFLGLIMLIDSNANARLEAYRAALVSAAAGLPLK